MTEAANGVAEVASRGAAGGDVPAAVLRRVCGLLDECAIPFQLTGDVAAAAYGAPRPIRSVELFIAAEHVPALLRRAEEHVVDYPWRRRDDAWDRVAPVAVLRRGDDRRLHRGSGPVTGGGDGSVAGGGHRTPRCP